MKSEAMRVHCKIATKLIVFAAVIGWSIGQGPGAAFAGTAAADWPTYGFNSLRTGYNPSETQLSPATVGGLQQVWAFNPSTLEATIDPTANPANAWVFAEPMVASAVPIGGQPTETLYVGDGNGTFVALDAHTHSPAGNLLWSRSLGRVTSIAPHRKAMVLGVRSAAAFDRAANAGVGAVYLGINGQVHAMDMTTGAELSGWPVTLPGPGIPTDEGFVHDGVNVVNGKLYVATSSPSDDPPWYGRLISVNTATAQVGNVWYSLSGNALPPATSATGGGIWGGGAAAIDPSAASGGIYVATGNAYSAPNERLYSEYVVNLSPDLSTIAGYASPAIPAGDLDYGSTPVVFQPAGCPSKMLAVKNKSGLLVIESIASNGALSVVQSTKVANTVNMIGNAAWDVADQLLLLTTPAKGPEPFEAPGLYAFRPEIGCTQFDVEWFATKDIHGTALRPGAMSSVTVANGVAYFAGPGPKPLLFAVATVGTDAYPAGQVLWQSAPSTNCLAVHSQSAPVVVNGWVYLSCTGAGATVRAFSFVDEGAAKPKP